MKSDPSKSEQSEQLHKLADALGNIRDSLVTVSLALSDLVTEMPSTARDEVVTEVERYLSRLRDANRRGFE
jgi:hypothetical protein